MTAATNVLYSHRLSQPSFSQVDCTSKKSMAMGEAHFFIFQVKLQLAQENVQVSTWQRLSHPFLLQVCIFISHRMSITSLSHGPWALSQLILKLAVTNRKVPLKSSTNLILKQQLCVNFILAAAGHHEWTFLSPVAIPFIDYTTQVWDTIVNTRRKIYDH